MVKRRNPLGNLPILGKGGAHHRTRSALRARARRGLCDELADWYAELDKENRDALDAKDIEPSPDPSHAFAPF